jgi:hypothetical protein
LKLSKSTATKQLEPNTALFYAKFSGCVKGFRCRRNVAPPRGSSFSGISAWSIAGSEGRADAGDKDAPKESSSGTINERAEADEGGAGGGQIMVLRNDQLCLEWAYGYA